MVAADFSDYLQFVLTDPRHCGNNSFYTATDALLNLEAEVVQKDETQVKGEERTPKQIERLPVLEMLRKYGLGGEREHLLLVGKPGSGKSTTLRRLFVEMAEIALGDNLQPIPVFVQLKGDKQIVKLIQAEFRRAKLKVTDEQIDDLLLEDKLVLLLDGVNEIPSEELRRELQDFRENNLTTPMIFTTRDLTVGGSLGIDKRLEMRPLTDSQMREFVHKYLPEHGDKLLGQLRDRLREIAETPLLLKMLCEVFEPETGRIPHNKAELFELFDHKYQRHKEGVAISANFRRFQSEILQYLAFTMLQGDAEKPTEAWLTLSRSRAEGIIEAWLKHRGETDPASKAKEWLEDLVEHHLLQVAADPQQIEFHHQLFQEYYAARYLRSMLQNKHPDFLDDDRLKHFYLNYLKWTEPLGLLLGLLNDEAQALRLVGLGLEVDWFLGARLAGEVKEVFQQQTVGLIDRLIEEKDLPKWLKLELLERTRSERAINLLIKFLNDPVVSVRRSAARALGEINSVQSVNVLIELIHDPAVSVRKEVVRALGEINSVQSVNVLIELIHDPAVSVREEVIRALGEINSVQSFDELIQVWKSEDNALRGQVESILRQSLTNQNHIALKCIMKALLTTDYIERPLSAYHRLYNDNTKILKELSYEQAILIFTQTFSNSVTKFEGLNSVQVVHILTNALGSSEINIPGMAAKALGEIGSEQAIPALIQATKHSQSNMNQAAIKALGKIGSEQAIPALVTILNDSQSNARQNAAKALGEIGSEQAIPALVKALNDSDIIVVQTAVKALGAVRSEQALLELKKFLDNSSRDVRQMAAKILNSIVLDEPVSTSSKDLDDQNSYVFQILCQLAAELLGEIKSEQAVPALVQALNGLNLDVRKAAIKALTRIGSEQALSELTKAFFANLDTRQILTNLFTDNRCGQLFTTISQAFSDTMNYVDESKIDMSKEINVDQSIPTLIKLLDHPTANEREQAAQTLGAIRCEQAVNSLISLLKDPVSLVRGSSAQALGAIGSERAANALVQALNDPVSGVRWRVAEALGHIASERAINGLITALEDSDPIVREIAADALGKIKGDNVNQNLSLLVRMLSCKREQAVMIAIAAIQNRCKFYNYEIWREATQSEKINDKNESKIFSSVETTHIFPNVTEVKIDRIGILNTGSVNLQNQIGIQQPEQPK